MNNIIKIPRQLDITELINAMDDLNSTCALIIKQVQSRQAINTIILNKLYTCNKELRDMLADDVNAQIDDATGISAFLGKHESKLFPAEDDKGSKRLWR